MRGVRWETDLGVEPTAWHGRCVLLRPALVHAGKPSTPVVMNACHRLIAASALILPLSAWSQDNPSMTTVGSAPVAESPVRRIEHGDLSRAFTARDLIGKNVVNYDGERLGTINDVGLSETWAERFGTTPVDTKGEPMQSSLMPSAPAGDQVVYISTGGLLGLSGRLGMGADWVSVPADSLLYDRAQDRFILNMPQARFESVAQGEPRIEQQEESAVGTAVGQDAPMISQSDADGATATQSAEMAGDVNDVQDALREHDALRGKSRIQVSHTGNVIELTGQVDDAALIRRAGDIAREHTTLEVRNLLEVSSSAAE